MTNIKNTVSAIVLGWAACLASGAVQAQGQGDCAVSYTRTACPGKETESFAKCDGKAACTRQVEATTGQACQAAATKACANDRLDITKSKVIKASYKGQALKSASGSDDFCVDYDKRAAEFDKCGK